MNYSTNSNTIVLRTKNLQTNNKYPKITIMKNLLPLFTALLFVSCSKDNDNAQNDDTTNAIEPINISVEHYEGHMWKMCPGENVSNEDFRIDMTYYIGVQNDEIIIGNMNTQNSLVKTQHEIRIVDTFGRNRAIYTFNSNDHTQGYIWKIDVSIDEFIANEYELTIQAGTSITIKNIELDEYGYIYKINGVTGNRLSDHTWSNVEDIEHIKQMFDSHVNFYRNYCIRA